MQNESTTPEGGQPRRALRTRLFSAGLGALTAVAVAAPTYFLVAEDWFTDDADTDPAAQPLVPSTDVEVETETDAGQAAAGIEPVSSTAGARESNGFPTRPPSVEKVRQDTLNGVMAFELGLTDPLGITRGQGLVDLRLDTETGQVCFDISTSGIAAPYPAGIFRGVSGQDGTMVVDLGEQPSANIGCVAADPATVAAVGADPVGHYIAFDDPDLGTALRSQLATTGDSAGGLALDPDGGGATVMLSPDAVTLTGVVPNHETHKWFADLFADALVPGIQLVDDLRNVPDTPAPSGRIFLHDDLLFDLGSTELLAPDNTVIRQLAAILLARPDWTVNIVGHTDNVGNDEANLALSQQRAESIRAELITLGVAPDLLSTEGAGANRPIADNTTPEGRAQNRRIEIQVAPIS